MRPALVAVDADDTLWHNESLFRLTEARFAELLGDHARPETIAERLLETERRNLAIYGYGVKGFTLSMIETAHEITDGDCPPEITRALLGFCREMLAHPVEPFDGVGETLETLARRAPLILVTKGDLFDQERKLAQSGLGEMFAAVEVVSEKTADTYARLFARHGPGAERALMAGNSLKSDVIPPIDAGGWGVHVPYEITWVHEAAEPPEGHPRYRRIDRLSALPALLETLETP